MSFDTISRVEIVARERGTTPYKLFIDCGLNYSLYGNAKRRHSNFSLDTIEILCDKLGSP